MSQDALQIIHEEHTAIAAMLRSLKMLVEQGPGTQRQRFFEVLRSMLYYMDEFPERRHHVNESRLLFPMLMRGAPELRTVIERLEIDHEAGERKVRELQHLLIAWEVLGDRRREPFERALNDYVRFYLDHMRTEEKQLLPVAQRLMSQGEKLALDSAFERDRDPLAGGEREPEYEALFSQIVLKAPAPIGLGDE